MIANLRSRSLKFSNIPPYFFFVVVWIAIAIADPLNVNVLENAVPWINVFWPQECKFETGQDLRTLGSHLQRCKAYKTCSLFF